MEYKYLIFTDTNEELRYSSKIQCIPNVLTGETKTLKIKIGSEENVPYATTNVQDNYAYFESIAFSVWSILPQCEVVLEFDELKWNEHFPVNYNFYEKTIEDELKQKKKTITSAIQHYMRFLYRVMNMKRQYNKLFHVDEGNKSAVEKFEKEFDKAIIEKKFRITSPQNKSNIKHTDKISENHLEKWFVMNSEKGIISKKIPDYSRFGEMILFDQFPCGLFYEDKNEENRIFNKGAFDLWGITSNEEICLFELKKDGNCSLGIISELFFYSCLMKDFKQITSGVSDKDILKIRGFNSFLKAKDEKINAYFLVPRFHSFIENHLQGILIAMNSRNNKDIIYGYIKFNQNNLWKGIDEKKFMNLVEEEWDERQKRLKDGDRTEDKL